ncbi:MAG: hypothetical protein AB7V13_13815 [Pseudorhodoplanes sp.]
MIAFLLPSVVRAADILELLKTHKIVVGPTCIDQSMNARKPCAPPPVSARTEIILAKGVIYERDLAAGGRGLLYPVGREEDLLVHPLTKESFERSKAEIRYDYFRSRADVSGEVLTLVLKSRSTLLNPRFTSQSVDTTTITVKGDSCSVLHKPQGITMRRARCTLVPLSTGTGEGPAPRSLSLLAIARTYQGKLERTSEYFTLINDRLNYPMVYCADGSQLAVAFDWKGGALSGTHRCDTETAGRVNHNTLTYKSTVTVERDVYSLVASGTHDDKGYAGYNRSFEIEIRLVVSEGKCELEKFYLKEHYGHSAPFIRSNDAESKCFLD